MKFFLLFVGLLVMSVLLGMGVAPSEGRMKFYFMFVEVLVASIILGIVVAHVANIR